MSCAHAPLCVLIVHDGCTEDSAESRALGALDRSLDVLGVRVIAACSADDGLAVLRSDASVDVALVDWDLSGDAAQTQELLTRARRQNDRLPIWLMADRTAGLLRRQATIAAAVLSPERSARPIRRVDAAATRRGPRAMRQPDRVEIEPIPRRSR